MNKTEKGDAVAQLAGRLNASASLYLTDFTGISVKNLTDLRRRFRAEGVEFVVVKNSLALRAFQQAEIAGLEDVLRGPTGVVLAGSDPVTAARILADFQKEQDNRPAIKAGFVDRQTMGPEQVKRLAALPTRDVMLSLIAGALQAPLAGFVGALNGLLYEFAGSLEALRSQRDEGS